MLLEASERTIGFFDDNARLRFGQVRPDRQAQNGISEAFGQGKSAARPLAVGISAGKVRGYRIMDQGADACFGELLLKLIALRMADYKEVPNRFGPVRHEGQRQFN